MPKIVINQVDFLKGAAETDFENNGGYSPEDKSGNIYVKRGVLAPPPQVLSNTGAVKPIAIFDSLEETGTDIRGVGYSANVGFFYTFNALGEGVLTSQNSADVYTAKRTDMVYYKSNFFVSSATEIARFDNSMGSANYDWWSIDRSAGALADNTPHQMLVFGAGGSEKVFIANGHLIASWDDTDPATAFTLPSNYRVTAIIEFQSKIYIAAEPYANASGTYHGKAALFVWDGVETTLFDELFQLEDRVDSMYVYQGSLLLFTKRYMGYWNGITIERLRDLTSQVFKGMITQYNDRLYIVQGADILIYDGKRFSYLLGMANDIDAIMCNAESNILISSNTLSHLSFVNNNDDIQSISRVGTGNWRSRRYNFGQNVIIKKLTIELAEDLASGSDIEFNLIDHTGTSTEMGDMTFATDGAVRFKEIENINLKCLSGQFQIEWKATSKQIMQLTIEYEPTRNPVQ